MTNEADKLIEAARQILKAESALSGGLLPRRENLLPELPAEGTAGLNGEGDLSEEDKARLLEEMNVGEVAGCVLCRLSENRTQTVFGEGRCDADLVFVGEGPGQEEDRTGRPFVGRAGELLTRMIQAMGMKREDVFICNVVKCRPPNNRAPMADEAEACWPYLLRQLEIIAPKVIVTLGNPATQRLLDTRVGITRLRGHWQELPPYTPHLGGIAVMPTFHPAYILRQYNQDTRAKVWSDLQKVMDVLGLEVRRK